MNNASNAVDGLIVKAGSVRFIVVASAEPGPPSSPKLWELLSDVQAEEFLTVSAAAEVLFNDAEAQLIGLYPNPIIDVATHLVGEGCTRRGIDAHLEQTIAWMGAVLRLFRKHRGRITLVDWHGALADIVKVAEQTQGSAAVKLHNLVDQAFAAPPGPNLLSCVVAQAAIHWSDSLRPLFTELHAGSVPLASPIVPDPDMLLDDWVICADETVAQGLELKERNRLTSLQLRQLQEELEEYFVASRKLGDELALTKDKMKRREEEQKKRIRTLEKKVDRLENRWSQVFQSTLWKLTAPLRKGQKFLTRSDRKS